MFQYGSPMFMAIILMLLALLHTYWAIGGRWPARDARALAELVVGTRQMASAGACYAVAPYHWWNLRLYSPLRLSVAALGALELW